jgi:hypothetical protein
MKIRVLLLRNGTVLSGEFLCGSDPVAPSEEIVAFIDIFAVFADNGLSETREAGGREVFLQVCRTSESPAGVGYLIALIVVICVKCGSGRFDTAVPVLLTNFRVAAIFIGKKTVPLCLQIFLKKIRIWDRRKILCLTQT